MSTLILNLIIGFIIGYLGIAIYERIGIWIGKKRNKPPHLDIKGFRLHHSIYGAVFIIFAMVFNNIALLAAGIGIIVQHFFTGDGLVFITRVKNESNNQPHSSRE